jgi:hypothetical protein
MILELTTTNVGPEVGVSQHASQSSTMTNASGQAAPIESSDEDSDDEYYDYQKWDEGYISTSSDDDCSDSGDWEISVEPVQIKEDEAQGSSAPSLLEMRRQGTVLSSGRL